MPTRKKKQVKGERSQMWCHTPGFLGFNSLRQENHEFEAGLGYTGKSKKKRMRASLQNRCAYNQ